MIKAIIFDMDGLLIDSEPFWRAAHVAAMAKQGVTITEEDVRAMAGRRTDEVVKEWHQRYQLDITAAALEKIIVDEVIADVRSKGAALPGVDHVIKLAKEQGSADGRSFFVVTGDY